MVNIWSFLSYEQCLCGFLNITVALHCIASNHCCVGKQETGFWMVVWHTFLHIFRLVHLDSIGVTILRKSAVFSVDTDSVRAFSKVCVNVLTIAELKKSHVFCELTGVFFHFSHTALSLVDPPDTNNSHVLVCK